MSETRHLNCPTCKAKLFDGDVIKGVSVLKLCEDGSFSGMCKRCKSWVRLPLIYRADNIVSLLAKSDDYEKLNRFGAVSGY